MNELQGRRALVTGAAQGIGLAIALAMVGLPDDIGPMISPPTPTPLLPYPSSEPLSIADC